jgi:hypothetical protein
LIFDMAGFSNAVSDLMEIPGSSAPLALLPLPQNPAAELPFTFFVLTLDRHVKAVTDRGRDIPLFRYDALVLPPEGGQQRLDPRADRQLLLRLLQEQHLSNVAPPGSELVPLVEPRPVSNCHGWVFTSGQYGIQDPHVPSVMKENGYIPVLDPQESDLALYTGEAGIKHSGIVRRPERNGKVLIESKWGPFGVFLHAPQVHPGGCSFYRSPRQGHQLTIASISG